jgi:Raf kinase inhibitor-like YbhB/YbcL family protein
MRLALALLLTLGCSRAPTEGSMNLTSPSFGEGQSIPAKYTCTGANVSPPLEWKGVPAGAKWLALTVDDPDAPGGHFTHWQVSQIPATTTAIPEGGHAGVERENGFGKSSYGGPCPPSGEHRYVFTLTALDEGGREVGRARLVGRYRK